MSDATTPSLNPNRMPLRLQAEAASSPETNVGHLSQLSGSAERAVAASEIHQRIVHLAEFDLVD
jgi:hypothetical protein